MKATLEIEYDPGVGLYYVGSPEWRGMLLAGHDLNRVLSDVVPAGKGLYRAMKQWHDDPEKPPYSADALAQMERYRQFFG